MPPASPEDYLKAADGFLANIEASRQASKEELESVRTELAAGLRADARKATSTMGTINIGGNKVIAPNSENLRKLNLTSRRSRERMSNFRLSYLDRSQVEALSADGREIPADTRQFIRHSRRLARHARKFLADIQELEPDLEEEVQEALMQLEDNDMDLLKLEVKSFTRMRETLIRGAAGRKSVESVNKEIDAFDLNRNLWNLSLVEHPRAAVQSLMANAAEAMGSRATKTVRDLPKSTLVLAAPTPNAVTRMTPASRTADVSWRIFSAKELDDRFEAINTGRQSSPSSWRGLGIGPNSNEWFMPVPPEIATGLRPIVAARRAALLAAIEARSPL